MISTYSHQSSDSSNSNDTNFCVSPSVIMGSSPGGFNSSGMSSAHHHHYPRHHSESYEMNTSHPVTSSSSHYYPQQNYEQQTQTVRPTNLRPTPISLGWAGNWEIGQFYDLELPTKESKVKEPYLVLLKDFPESSYTPRIVYLDSEAYVSPSPPPSSQILTLLFHQQPPKKPPPLPIPRPQMLGKERLPPHLHPLRGSLPTLRTPARTEKRMHTLRLQSLHAGQGPIWPQRPLS